MKRRRGACLIIDPELPDWIRTSEVGSRIFQICDGTLTVNQVIAALASEYGVQPAHIKDDVLSFVSRLMERGLLWKDEPKPRDVPARLSSVWLHVTRKCNLRCPYCYFDAGEASKNELTADEMTSLFRELSSMGVEGVNVSGGEPLTRKDIVELLRSGHSLGLKFCLISNGLLWDEATAKEILRYVASVQITIDGSNERTNQKLRGEGSFRRAVSTIKMIQTLGFDNVILAFTMTRLNAHDLLSMVDLAYSLRVKTLHINNFMPVGRGGRNRYLAVRMNQFSELMNQAYLKYQNLLQREGQEEKDALSPPVLNLHISGSQYEKVLVPLKRLCCGLGVQLVSVDSTGTVYPCPSLHLPGFELGNIREKSFADIYEHGRGIYEKMTVDNIQGCKDCRLRYLCGGGCRVLAFDKGNSLLAKDRWCGFYRQKMMGALWTVGTRIL
jgi:radical SAM protein with 4Fe4S-binding SPASM domain